MSPEVAEQPVATAPTARRNTMLAPIAYSETTFTSLRLAKATRGTRRIAKFLFVALLITIPLLSLLPWQQSIPGSGNVIAFSPNERPQTIEAPIQGRLHRWGENIFENALVQKGELIAEIHDLDDSYAARLDEKLRNAQQNVQSAELQEAAYKRALEAAISTVESYALQLQAYTNIKQETIAAQNAYVKMAEQKVQAEQQQLAEYQAALPQLKAELDRVRTLHAEGNIALQKLQEVERKYTEADAKFRRGEAYVSSAKSELEGKLRDRTAYIEKAQVNIDYAEALLRKAGGDVSKSEGDLAKVQQDVNKSRKELLDLEITVSRQETQFVKAPFEGFIVSINPNLNSAVLKQGDPLCTIVPKTADRAVQIWLNGNDAPLVEAGRHVRLQFEGWPALQFAGWPSVAVGTFGGEVVSVDATDDGMGKFRALIRPAKDDHDWPGERFLRQGVRANGWVLLDQVPLWYEIWRRLNGFPPVVKIDQQDDNSYKPKPPKIPK